MKLSVKLISDQSLFKVFKLHGRCFRFKLLRLTGFVKKRFSSMVVTSFDQYTESLKMTCFVSPLGALRQNQKKANFSRRGYISGFTRSELLAIRDQIFTYDIYTILRMKTKLENTLTLKSVPEVDLYAFHRVARNLKRIRNMYT